MGAPITADTESVAYDKAKKSTNALLALLIEHHDYRVPKAPKAWSVQMYVAPVVQEQEAPTKEPWFSIVEEINPPEPQRPRVDQIQQACAKYYGVTRDDILSPRRTASVVLPRQVGYYLSRTLTLKTLPEIGRRFGNRDHTSVLSGVRKIERLMQTDAKLHSAIEAISRGVSQ